MSAIERELIERISRLDVEKQRRVLEYVQHMEATPPERRLSPQELMHLPPEERNRLVAEAFELAVGEDFEVFEAYSEEGLDDLS